MSHEKSNLVTDSGNATSTSTNSKIDTGVSESTEQINEVVKSDTSNNVNG